MTSTKEPTDLELANKIALAFKNDLNVDNEVIQDGKNISIGGDELTILFHNKRIVAFTTWSYDGTWFGVVDLEKDELIMSSTDSVMFNDYDRLIIYKA